MSFGKIYTVPTNPRTIVSRIVAKQLDLDVEFVYLKDHRVPANDPDFVAKFPLGRVPCFEGPDGWKLHENIAIVLYLLKQDPNTKLLGTNDREFAEVLQWLSWANSDLLVAIGGFFRPTVGKDPYNKKSVDDAVIRTRGLCKYLDDKLQTRTFLVGERLTIADYHVTAMLSRGFESLFDPEWRKDFPNVTRFWTTVHHQKLYKEVQGEPKFIDERMKYNPPKQEKPKKEAAEPAPKPKKVVEEKEEEDDTPKETKAKHPLDSLGSGKMVLDEWKRTYSNNDTPDALKWLWEHFDPEAYSFWRVDYKYNDELGLVFQSSNLCGGFFQRLEASRKHIFGTLCVYGESNNSVVSGAFLVRGQDALPAFDVAPDYESYDFKKLDVSNSADKEFVEGAWSWDRPVEVNGKKYEFADGKVFK